MNSLKKLEYIKQTKINKKLCITLTITFKLLLKTLSSANFTFYTFSEQNILS